MILESFFYISDRKRISTEALEMIQADGEAPVIPVDSSSDDEDHVAEGTSDDSDNDYRLPSSERYVK